MTAYSDNFRPWLKKGIPNPGYVTIRKAAEMMGVQYKWFYNWIWRHDVPTISLGPNRKRYIPVEFITKYGNQFTTYFQSLKEPY